MNKEGGDSSRLGDVSLLRDVSLIGDVSCGRMLVDWSGGAGVSTSCSLCIPIWL